jgi:transglutaminase-like putative cysteine protease
VLAKVDDLIAEQYLDAANALKREYKYAEALLKVKDGLALVPKSKVLADARVALEPLVDFKEIDRYALATEPINEKTIKDLGEYLAKPSKDDRTKARAIYRWVTDRIAYDADGFFSGQIGDCSAEAVLRTRKTVCAGYSNLFEKLGAEAGLRVQVVGGIAKGYDFNRGDDLKKFSHAWNAVWLEEKWQLVDSTWGAGSLTKDKKFEKKFTSYYFLTPPDQLIFDHFPDAESWQLVKPSVTQKDFLAWAKPPRALFTMGFSSKDVRAQVDKNPLEEFVEAFDVQAGKIQIVAAPLEKTLRADKKYAFRIDAPDVDEVSFHNADKWNRLVRQGTAFEGEVAPAKGVLQVLAKTGKDQSRFAVLLKYDVK